jgi:hypothetical protein
MKTCIVTACLLCAALFSQAGDQQKPTNPTSVIEVTCYSFTASCGISTTLCIAHDGPLTNEAKKKAEDKTNKELCSSGGGGGATPEYIV